VAHSNEGQSMQIGLVGLGPMARIFLRPLVKVGRTTVVWDGSQGTIAVLGMTPQTPSRRRSCRGAERQGADAVRQLKERMP
jgi:hypothetical protein